MITAIKLVLIYIGMQFLAGILLFIPCMLYGFSQGIGMEGIQNIVLAPSMVLSMVLMAVYLWKAGYIKLEKRTFSWVSLPYLAATLILTLPMIWVLDALVTPMHLPNFYENEFNLLQQGWLGILAISLFAPILEELLFRGAITGKLLTQYTPKVAILLSATVFGIIHLNPAQVLPAFLIGLLLGWMYYRTGSLVPGILVHLVNNSLSVFLSLQYAQEETLQELVGNPTLYIAITVAAALITVAALLYMNRTHVPVK